MNILKIQKKSWTKIESIEIEMNVLEVDMKMNQS